MAQLAVHVDFLSEFSRLEKAVQRSVQDVLLKFPGVDLEKVAGSRDGRLRTIRLAAHWRGVVAVPSEGEIYTLLRVAGDDEATNWAKQHTVSVNEVSGLLQVTNVDELERLVPEYRKAAEEAASLLFDRVKDAQLHRLGIDTDVLSVARTIRTLDQLAALENFLPEVQYTALFMLGSGYSPDDVWAQHVAPQLPTVAVDTTDLGAAAARSQGRVALVGGADELLALFDRPLARWRVFLHPAQEAVAYRPSYSGSAKISGGPGTGKTVAALHRVKHLVSSVTRGELPPNSVLLTSFSSGLAHALERDLAALLDVGQRLTVRVAKVDKLAHDLVTERHGTLRYLNENEYRRVWSDAAKSSGGRLRDHFFRREWESIVFAQRIADLDGYLGADRRGRGQRLSTEQRRQLWPGLAEASRVLRAGGSWTPLTVADEAARLLAERPEPLFRHVIVDEVQDLHPVQWRLLRAAVKPGPDDLFLTGDPHQRIYGNRVNLRAMGIEIAGRSTRLTMNYRTPAEVLAWAMRVLGDTDSDDLDGGIDSLLGYRSALHGKAPELVGYPTHTAENGGLVEAVRRWHEAGVGWPEIGVAARTTRVAASATAALTEAGLPTTTIRDAATVLDGTGGSIVVGTMHGMKGLEFRCVALVGVSDGAVPDPRALTPEEEDPLGYALDLQQERSLLFVAATRAREQLRVSWSGSPSSLLPPA